MKRGRHHRCMNVVNGRRCFTRLTMSRKAEEYASPGRVPKCPACGLNVPWNLAIVPAGANGAKGNRWWPDCPWEPVPLPLPDPGPHQLQLQL